MYVYDAEKQGKANVFTKPDQVFVLNENLLVKELKKADCNGKLYCL